MKKTAVINTLNALPKEFQLDELLERLMVVEKIDAGLKEGHINFLGRDYF